MFANHELAEEWKAEFPIGKVYNAPLLLSSNPSIGPLFFNPQPQTLTQLFYSPFLSPPFLSPHPRLSLPRFLSTTTPYIPASTSQSIATRFGPQYDTVSSLPLSHNRIQLLEFGGNGVIVFFSAGENLEQIGFLVVSVIDGNLKVNADNEVVFRVQKQCRSQIVKMLVNPVEDFSDFGGESVIGYLMAYTLYSIEWFVVKLRENEQPFLDYLGCKMFKTCAIVSSCWSPHLPEECLVLLENGGLYLFDTKVNGSSIDNFKGTRLKVSWENLNFSASSEWLGCEFSWHPRVLIVARSDSVFLVDVRSDECKITCLAKIENMGLYATLESRFLVFSRAGFDGFHFVLASDNYLVIYDVRKPLMPVLQWEHNLNKPCYIDIFRLSELRSSFNDVSCQLATESGVCIILGSFWNCEFSFFCYGPCLPNGKGSDNNAMEISRYCKSLYAWELPWSFFLSGRDCSCGDCLLKEDFAKDSLPVWVNWQQKDDIVLGYGVLSKNLTSLITDSREFSGFVLIRLMSSGKLESQTYSASWELVHNFKNCRGNLLSRVQDNTLYDMGVEDCVYPKKFKYLKLDYLDAFLNGDISVILNSSMKYSDSLPKDNSYSDFHEMLCDKLEICGFGPFRSVPAVRVVFDDISMPTSIRAVAINLAWSELPVELLHLAFSSYSEILVVLLDKKKVSLEFLIVPDISQLPPFWLRKSSHRSSKWSSKAKPSDTLVGPVLPLSVLLTLHDIRYGCPNSEEVDYSPDKELDIACNKIMEVAKEMSVSEVDDDEVIVSLADDSLDMMGDIKQPKPFIWYKLMAFGCGRIEGLYKVVEYTTRIAKLQKHDVNIEPLGLKKFDDLCPVELKYDDIGGSVDFVGLELKAYTALKRKFSEWQKKYSPYGEFCSKFKLSMENTD